MTIQGFKEIGKNDMKLRIQGASCSALSVVGAWELKLQGGSKGGSGN